MFKRRYVFVLFSVLFFFSACKKEDLGTVYDYKTLGRAAHDLLSSDTYTSLQIEIGYMPGCEPGATALDSLSIFLGQYLNKPNGIKIMSHPLASSGKPVLTLNEIVDIEKKNRQLFTKGDVLAVHILIVDAAYSEPDNLALSYWNTSFCLFEKSILANSGGVGQMTNVKLVSVLLQHEFGHLLGLVGQGSPMQTAHRDNNQGAHCSNRSCLMYYGIETAENLSGGSPIPKLDANCLADLRGNGGK
jgi:hypothetical protein